MKIKIFYLSIGLILLGGIFFRFFDLGDIPRGLHYDEAFNGLDAINAIETGDYKIFYTRNTGREGLHLNAEAFFMRIFGINNFGLRFANAFWGMAAIVGIFFLLRELRFSRWAILAGTFALAFSFWHLDFSRTAYRGIMVPMVLIWLFYFFMRGLNRPRHKFLNFTAAGFFLGIGFHTYIAFRAAPLVFLALAAILIYFRQNFIRQYWRYAALFSAVSLAIALPIFIYFSQHREELIVRTESVSIFDDPKTSWAVSLKKSFLAHAEAFIWRGDANPRYNFNRQPLAPFLWQAFFLSGFFLSAREIYKNFKKLRKAKKENVPFEPDGVFYASVLAQISFWVMLIPGILSIEGVPHSLRIIGTIPAMIIFLAMPFESMSSYFKKYKKTAIAIFAVFAIGGFFQVYTYFFRWADDARTLGGYEKKLYDFGMLVKKMEPKEKNYIILTQNANISADHKESSFKTTEFAGYPNIKRYAFFKPNKIGDIDCDAERIIIFEDSADIRDRYIGKCPEARAEFITPEGGIYGFWVIKKNNNQ